MNQFDRMRATVDAIERRVIESRPSFVRGRESEQVLKRVSWWDAESVSVSDLTPPNHATSRYGVVVKAPGREFVICTHCYLNDAEAIAHAISTTFGIPREDPS